MKLFAKGIIGVILQVAFVAAGLFLGAGTFYWQDGLILLVIFIIMGFVFVIISSICYPKNLESRLILPGKSQPITDRIVTVLFLIFVASLMIFIPLDIFHFQLFSSPIPPVKYFGISPKRSLPPLIYVAFALTKLINEIGIISKELENIQGGQEVKWCKPVTPGEKITAICKLKSNIERKEIRFASITVEYISGNFTIGESTTTIIIKQG